MLVLCEMTETSATISVNVGKGASYEEREEPRIRLILHPPSSADKRAKLSEEATELPLRSPNRTLFVRPAQDENADRDDSDEESSLDDMLPPSQPISDTNESVAMYLSDDDFTRVTYTRHGMKRKTKPYRAIPQIKTFQQRMANQIVTLEFSPSLNSENASYMDGLVSYYRTRNEIHEARIKRRHDRIIGRGKETKRISKRFKRQSLTDIDTSSEAKRSRRRVRRIEFQAAEPASPTDSIVSAQQSPRSVDYRMYRSPLDLSTHPLAVNLEDDEKALCVKVRVQPDQYLTAKEQLTTAYQKYGFFHKTAARKYVRGIDVNRLGKLWEFFVSKGWLVKS